MTVPCVVTRAIWDRAGNLKGAETVGKLDHAKGGAAVADAVSGGVATRTGYTGNRARQTVTARAQVSVGPNSLKASRPGQ
jgi:hypothetical protein